MLMSGRCGFCSNCLDKSGPIKSVAPGNAERKNGSICSGLDSKVAKAADGAKRVQVKVWSVEGMAMNILSLPGQMWRWFGLVLKPSLAEGVVLIVVFELTGGMVNSHHRVSMYDCS